jgi:glycosyltransferase involved in cell wall biosynthesis
MPRRTTRTAGSTTPGPEDVVLGEADSRDLSDWEASRAAPSVVVILPAYNEELTIVPTIHAFHTAIPEAEIVVVDNDSSDRTGDLALSCFGSLDCRWAVITEKRRGKGNAVRRAFHDVEADIYVLVDADMTYPADRVRDLIDPIATNRADMVVGDRLKGGHYQRENKRPFHDFGNRVVLFLVNRLFDAQLSDIMSGYRVMSADFVHNYPILVEGFEIETDMTLHALDKRFRIMEIPVEYVDRPEGSSSKLNTFSDGLRVLRTISNLARHYRPMLFFGLVAIVFFVAGLFCGVPVIGDWVAYQYIYRVPLAILATGLMVLAAGSLGIGLILDSVVHQDRLDFERDYQLALKRRRHGGD